MTADPPASLPDPWSEALRAAALLAVDPALGGAVLRARAGPVREAWLAHLRDLLPGRPWARLPPGAGDEALSGGLDLAATLAAGRPQVSLGLLERARGGVLVLPMAEQTEAGLAARLAAALDADAGRRLVALDEGAEPDEAAPGALADRLAFRLDLAPIAPGRAVRPDAEPDAVAAARARLAAMPPDDELAEAMASLAAAFGIGSLRAAWFALRAARAAAAVAGRDRVGEEDAALAARLVLAPRATRLPAPPESAEAPKPPPPPPPPGDPAPETEEGEAERFPEEMLVAAALAALPPDLLARLAAGGRERAVARTGGAGAERRTPLRGRPRGTAPGRPRGGARLDLIASLRAAAPWQPLRRREAAGRGDARPGILVRVSDLRIRRFSARSESTVIFLVDASGSTALARLGEAKGAVALLLAEAYVRRDSVALIAFRGTGAELLLPPTRSLVQAKRRLDGLPGGGGTPLAAGLAAALELAGRVRRGGATPFLAVLTDGRANVALDGTGGRERAEADALRLARAIAAGGTGGIVIDTGARPQAAARTLAAALGAPCLPLPRAEAGRVAAAVRAVMAAQDA